MADGWSSIPVRGWPYLAGKRVGNVVLTYPFVPGEESRRSPMMGKSDAGAMRPLGG
jgi:hypothetical protein